MDFLKIFEASKMPAAILIGIGVLGAILSLIPAIGGMIAGLLGALTFFIITPIVLTWSGYNHAKTNGADFVGGAMVGATVGAMVAAVNGVVSIVFAMLGFGSALGQGIEGLGGAALGAASLMMVVFGLFISIFVLIVVGLVLGAVGAYLSKHI